jgi:hypothetical protein
VKNLTELYYDGLTYKEIAAELGWNYTKVQKTVRALIQAGDLEKRNYTQVPIPKKGRIITAVILDVELPELDHACGPDCYCWNQEQRTSDADYPSTERTVLRFRRSDPSIRESHRKRRSVDDSGGPTE